MLKLLIKLAIAAVLANAVYHIGLEYLNHIKFRDAVRDTATFKAKTDAELRDQIMKLAEEYDVPLDPDALAIRREQRQVFVDGSYEKPIEVLPRYEYPWHFSWSIEANTETTILPGAPVR